jgi:hypothetical protein
VMAVSWNRSMYIVNDKTIIIYNNHGSTALYGLRPPLSEVTGSCACCSIDPDVTARAVRRLG